MHIWSAGLTANYLNISYERTPQSSRWVQALELGCLARGISRIDVARCYKSE